MKMGKNNIEAIYLLSPPQQGLHLKWRSTVVSVSSLSSSLRS